MSMTRLWEVTGTDDEATLVVMLGAGWEPFAVTQPTKTTPPRWHLRRTYVGATSEEPF